MAMHKQAWTPDGVHYHHESSSKGSVASTIILDGFIDLVAEDCKLLGLARKEDLRRLTMLSLAACSDVLERHGWRFSKSESNNDMLFYYNSSKKHVVVYQKGLAASALPMNVFRKLTKIDPTKTRMVEMEF